jgi:hypothetical protein
MTAHSVPGEVARVRGKALAAGIAGTALCALGLLVDPGQAYRSWLFAFLFWSGVSVGCLSILMIQHLTGGLWGLTIRRILEAGSRTLRYAWVLFLPLLAGLAQVFVWADPAALGADEHLKHAVEQKHLYLNPAGFLARAAFYFVVWAVLAQVLSQLSLRQDGGWTRKVARQLRGISGGGLLLMGLTITFSSIDWGMSLDPRWFSHIWGVLFMVGQALSAMALCIVLIARIGGEAPLSRAARPGTVHDLGKLMFAFVMLWAYVNLSQFLIIWSGNLPEEIPWYVQRLQGTWQAVALLLLVCHFILPFLMLLSRDLKRNARMLATVAAGIFVMRIVDLYWLVGPELHRGAPVHWLDLAALLGIGGLWNFQFTRELLDRPLLPVGDPELEEALEAAH